MRITLLTLLFSFATPLFNAHAETDASGAGPFFGSDWGLAIKEDTKADGLPGTYEFETGFRTDLDLGYWFANGIFAFAEAGYIYNAFANTIGNVELHQVPVLANIGYEAQFHDEFKPFVSFGIGPAVSIVSFGDTRTDVTVAHQVEFGMRWHVSDRCWIGASYKYLSTGNVDFDVVAWKNIVTHGISLTFDFML